MQIFRTVVWVLLFSALLMFSFFNWTRIEVVIWDNLRLETTIPALVVVAFLIGLVPMWLYHRSVKWSLKRRIRTLENSIKSSAIGRRDTDGETGAQEKPAAASDAAAVKEDTRSDARSAPSGDAQERSAARPVKPSDDPLQPTRSGNP